MTNESPRQVVSILGLPFDIIDLEQAVERVDRAMANGESMFISTPNLNFLAASLRDPAFKQSVLESDLSLADGASVVLLARLLGIRLPGRVAGSDLFEKLWQRPKSRLKVYFFGGPEGAAEKATQRINESSSPAQAVGYANPGFGSVEQMSSATQLGHIQAAKPNFLLVALGAQKGQSWIMHNRAALPGMVISHLGAVVNFVAGSVTRAPKWVQRIGCEWLWRIKEEPAIWRRYWDDGKLLAKTFAIAGPRIWLNSFRIPVKDFSQSKIIAPPASTSDSIRVDLIGAWGKENSDRLMITISDLTKQYRQVDLNLTHTTMLDAYSIGTLQALKGTAIKNRSEMTFSGHKKMQGIFKTHLAQDLLSGQSQQEANQ